jgi:hypothetical protein
VYPSLSSEARGRGESSLSYQLIRVTGPERESVSSGPIEIDDFTYVNDNDH